MWAAHMEHDFDAYQGATLPFYRKPLKTAPDRYGLAQYTRRFDATKFLPGDVNYYITPDKKASFACTYAGERKPRFSYGCTMNLVIPLSVQQKSAASNSGTLVTVLMPRRLLPHWRVILERLSARFQAYAITPEMAKADTTSRKLYETGQLKRNSHAPENRVLPRP
jgi:hypothetical protein